MTTYPIQTAGNNGLTVRVEYADVAGAYGGWFLTVVPHDGTEDADFNPANGASNGNLFAAGGAQRALFLAHVGAKLNQLLGVGHSAKWTATLVASVTTAVIEDDFA